MTDPDEEPSLMRIYADGLPDTQRYACPRKTVKELFGEDLASVCFWKHSFGVNRHCIPQPVIRGTIVANLSVDPDGRASLYLSPVPRAQYPDTAVNEFREVVLPQFRDWLTAMLARPETQISGSYEKILAEWVAGVHRLHRFRELRRSS